MKMIDPLAWRVWSYAGKYKMLDGLVLCAVSGGRDSMAMLHLLSALAEAEGIQIAAAHFNHRLRPTADRDETFVRSWCGDHGIPLTCGQGDVSGFAKREGLSIEDAARRLRYAFLEDAARDMGAAHIAAAHHREDNAETVLFHLLRGTGLQGLGGIPPVRGKIVRPLLETSRAEIDEYVKRNAIPYVEDESNRDTRFTRNRLRLEVLPLLEEISPGCGSRIAAAAELLREEDEYLRQEAKEAASISHGVGKDTLTGVWDAGAVIGRRIIRAAARRLGVELDRRTTQSVWGLAQGGYLDLPGGLCALRESNRLILRKQSLPPPPLVLREGAQDWGRWKVTLERWTGPAENTTDRIVLRETGGALAIAPWDGTGRLAVENGSRTIKRLFADAGVPVERRGEHPALLLDGQTAAVLGVAVDWALRPEEGMHCCVITFQKADEGRRP